MKTLGDLNLLASEVRELIITTLAKNGGHLSSNLGAVELTIALHYVFESPKDAFIFDVGHQCYTHKILTGRADNFSTLRTFGGIAGFCSPEESVHDIFYSGHAGTALSSALGLAKKRDLLGEDFYIITILGDGSLTCGTTLEALNNIPKDLKNFIVVLNDNKMSISKSVGAISDILDSGEPSFFEHFNLSYTGPVDGHNIDKLIETLTSLKNLEKPVLLHALTIKGKGMEKALLQPTIYHGVGCFNEKTGEFFERKNETFPEVFGKKLVELAKSNSQIVAISPAMMEGSCLNDFLENFPDRCFDVGIAESHFLAYSGAIAYDKKLKVFAVIYSSFLQRAFDNLFHDVCLQKLPIILCIDRAGLSGQNGPTHHGVYDIGFLTAMPSLMVCQPRNATILEKIMEDSLSLDNSIAIRYPNLPTIRENVNYSFGKGEVLATGKDILIIALGNMCYTALEIREMLTKKGFSCSVVDPIFIKPLDEELLFNQIASHDFVVTIEEHALANGFGSQINSFILQKNLKPKRALNLGIPDIFVPHGAHKTLLQHLGLDPKSITDQIIDILEII